MFVFSLSLTVILYLYFCFASSLNLKVPTVYSLRNMPDCQTEWWYFSSVLQSKPVSGRLSSATKHSFQQAAAKRWQAFTACWPLRSTLADSQSFVWRVPFILKVDNQVEKINNGGKKYINGLYNYGLARATPLPTCGVLFCCRSEKKRN